MEAFNLMKEDGWLNGKNGYDAIR